MKPDEGGEQPDPVLEAITALKSDFETKIAEIDQKNEQRFSQFQEQLKPVAVEEPPASAWQPKTWDDFPRLVEERGAEVAKRLIEQRDAEYAKQQEQEKAVQERINKEIDDQLSQLEKDGILPKVENGNNPDDAGMVARRELLALGVYLETPNLVRVAEQLKTNHDAGYSFDVTSNSWQKAERELPGRYAPVGSSSARSSANPSAGPNYDTISKARNFDDLIRYAEQHGVGPIPKFE